VSIWLASDEESAPLSEATGLAVAEAEVTNSVGGTEAVASLLEGCSFTGEEALS
jgi:hypothetical protein